MVYRVPSWNMIILSWSRSRDKGHIKVKNGQKGNFYSKWREHLLTYNSGGKATVIDYIMVRRENLRELKNCKVIPSGTPFRLSEYHISSLGTLS